MINGQLELTTEPLIPHIVDLSDDSPAEDNRDLVDDNTSQCLSQAEILDLKSSGISGTEIINALCKNSATFNGKTKFSQIKYLRKKQKK